MALNLNLIWKKKINNTDLQKLPRDSIFHASGEITNEIHQFLMKFMGNNKLFIT